MNLNGSGDGVEKNSAAKGLGSCEGDYQPGDGSRGAHDDRDGTYQKGLVHIGTNDDSHPAPFQVLDYRKTKFFKYWGFI